MKADSFFICLIFIQPDFARRFQKGKSAKDVGLYECVRAKDGTVNVGFRSEMNNGINRIASQDILNQRLIANVTFCEFVTIRRW